MPKTRERKYRRHHDDGEDSDTKGGDSDGSNPEHYQERKRRDNREERGRERGDDRNRRERYDKERHHRSRSRSRDRHRHRSRSTSRDRSRRSDRRHRSRSRDRPRERRRSRSKSRSPNRSKDKGKRSHRDAKVAADSATQETKGCKSSPPQPSTDLPSEKILDIVADSAKTIKQEECAVQTKGQSSPPVAQVKIEPADSPKEEEIIEAVKAEQMRLEQEMLKRRERLETWRRQQMLQDEKPKEPKEEPDEDLESDKKGWNLEDEDDLDDGNEITMDTEEVNGEAPDTNEGDEAEVKMEVEDAVKEKVVSEDEVDPLDAFMMGVQEEVNEIKNRAHKKAGATLSTSGKKGGATMITFTKVRSTGQAKTNKKGELLHNDQDAAEYSEEEYNDNDELASALLTIAKKNKKKELPKIDHKNIEYPPFRKDFYVEIPEIARMTKEEVVARRRELENIKVKGKNCPNPIKNFPQSGLSKKILDVMRKCKYEIPTPIQSQAIPAIMSGRDLIGIARTGSGKTLAFLLPMFRHILDQPPLDYDDGPISIILAPTRELAIQIFSECKKFCKPLKLRPVCVYGGTGISEQIADLKRGAEIIICTPGRMIDMLAANNGRVTNLRRVTYIVLDEADRMFDLGFEPQVTKIIGNVRPDRQTVLFSATFPRQMEALARKILMKPIEVQVGGRSVVCKDVHQSVIVIDDHQKYFKLLELLGIYHEKGSILVFVERQETADTLIRDLMKSSYVCMALHGGMDQFDRDSTIADFKNGVVKIMVATSVAARGLDVKHLILVVNYDCPNHYEDYVHRCGRTGRAGNTGNAYTFITPNQQKLAGDIIKALELSKVKVPSELEELWSSYAETMKAQGKSVKGKITFKKKVRRAIGFGGSGYKFDEREAVRDSEAKLKQKSALGLANDDDEDQYALLTMDKKLDEVFGGKVKVNDQNGPNAVMSGKPALLPTPPQSERLDLAMAIADKIVQSKNLVGGGASVAAQEAASSIMKGEEVKVSGAVLASQRAANINAKVGAAPANIKDSYLPVGAIVPGKKAISGDIPDTPGNEHFLKFSDEVEINGFPQQIRFRLTTREVLDDIGEYSESYISVRGLYIPAARKTNNVFNERPLFLSIEAKTERAVQLAKQEIKRVIKEEAQHMASRVKPAQHTGRYSVV